ncbi:ATP-binding protein [Neisseria musculi]|uniref:ATP-binding protein n=1 Tax=Neisseria musculi TaxID=1815583 RepID=UPI001FE4BE05|nr:ATP-binding protein [Neisseria musculi]
MLTGPGRAGETDLAVSLAYPAVMAGIKIRFVTAADLMLQPAAHNRGKRKSYLQGSVMGPRLPVIDETGCLPFEREANLFFNVAAKRYGRGSMILRADLPFGRRAGAFANDTALTAAMSDRLLRHCHVVRISGEIYRLKDKKKIGIAPVIKEIYPPRGMVTIKLPVPVLKWSVLTAVDSIAGSFKRLMMFCTAAVGIPYANADSAAVTPASRIRQSVPIVPPWPRLRISVSSGVFAAL